jgi:hypothetical protein
MKKMTELYQRRKKFIKLKGKKLSKFYNKRIYKVIFIFFSFNIIFYSYYISPNDFFIFSFLENDEGDTNDSNDINETNNYWFKNKTKFINYFMSNYNSNDVKYDLNLERKYMYFKVLIKNPKSVLNLEVKESLKNELGRKFRKNIDSLKNIFIRKPFNFGNHICGLNNILYYSEVLGIKNIYLNSSNNWYIKNNISTDKIHISLLSPKEINCNSQETFCGELSFHFFYSTVLKPERRSLILKDEIKRNLPKIKVHKRDLYIYIRSMSFMPPKNEYTPAPYCFYQKILSDFKFRKIYIISMNDKSPIIPRLLSDYPKIKFKLNKVEEDIAILFQVYNLVNAVSSFTQATISFNDNLKNLFEYEIYKVSQCILHFHYDFYKIKRRFTIYRMKPSEDYFAKMYVWKNSDEQIKTMFEDNCKYDFRKTIYTKPIFE